MGKEQELVQSIRANDVETFRKIIAKFKSKSSKFAFCYFCILVYAGFSVRRNNSTLTKKQTNLLYSLVENIQILTNKRAMFKV